MAGPAPSRMGFGDVVRTAFVGMRTRKLRAALSALGIVIGIASMVAVVGLSESSKSDLLAQLDRLGTNLLRVQATTGIGRGRGELPDTAAAMVARIAPVQATSVVDAVSGANVYRTDLVPADQTGGITVQAVSTNLLTTLGGHLAAGRFLDAASANYPTAVLGAVAAQRLGITSLDSQPMVWIGGRWFGVIGILDAFELSPDLDRAALVGMPAAATYLGDDGVPTTLYVRTDPKYVDQVRAVIPATANPATPEEVQVDRPSDALAAREAANNALTALLLGLGSVALLVGGVGIANVMVISVLERRGEIGLRRALGATKGQVRLQFLGEALLLSAVGGVGGVLLGGLATAVYSRLRGWGTLLPGYALAGGVAAAILIGVVAGLYPAARAARLSPTDALRTT